MASNSTKPLRTRVKICGLTREEDVHAAVHAGADAIGLVFYPGSKRAVDLARARQLRAIVPAFVDVTALFVNASPQDVDAVIKAVRPDLLQFHGDETPEQCAQYDHRYLRAFRVGGSSLATAQALRDHVSGWGGASGWLFDTWSAGYGGSGHQFDWDLLRGLPDAAGNPPVILAGGLDAQSVPEAITRVRPFAVDVSSGVEDAPGVKSAVRIGAFMRAVRQADDSITAGGVGRP